jgi:hypothetical protein
VTAWVTAMRRGAQGAGGLLVGACASVIAAIVVFVFGLEVLTVLAAVLAFAFCAWRWPLSGVVLLLLVSVDFLGLVPLSALPSLQVAGSIQVNTLDAMLVVLLSLAVVRLCGRGETPLFVWQTALVILAPILCVVAQMLSGAGSLGDALGAVRYMVYYSAYFVLVAALDTERSLRRFVGFLFVLAAVSVAVQVAEGVTGAVLQPLAGQPGVVAQGMYVTIAGLGRVAYNWNRAALLSFVATFLALGALVERAGNRLWLFLVAAAGTVGTALALVRQWYVYYVIAAVALLAAPRTARSRSVLALLLVASLVIAGVWMAAPFFALSFAGSLPNAILLRSAMLGDPLVRPLRHLRWWA